MDKYHVSISAEAFAAALFAHEGYDVSVQYGANQPEYDLMVSKRDRFIKVSVKGSQDGGWGLAQKYKKHGTSYHQAIDLWKSSHRTRKIVYCFVQFKGVGDGGMPRLYLATLSEIARQLHSENAGHGHCSLREYHRYRSGRARGYLEEIPEHWRFSARRIRELLR